MKISWPEGKTFAFTVFDDPDSQRLEDGKRLYALLADLGFRTTKGVWPLAATRNPNSPGDTCADAAYLEEARHLEKLGFEIGYHHAAPQDCTRQETIEGLDAYARYFGHDPVTMANHYNQEAIYWGPARLSGARRAIYNLATLGQTRNRHFGHVLGHPTFWGDICRRRIRYCRNFVFLDINTLRACPAMPYHDPERPYVKAWFASTEGSNVVRFTRVLREANQDRLEAEGGACIMYAHFGHGFVEHGEVNAQFRQLVTRLSRKNGWFVPCEALLDFLGLQTPEREISPGERVRLETKWLAEKFFRGTS